MIEPLPALDWVRLATGRDDDGRPILTGVHVTATELVATDGHRLHLAPRPDGVPEGIWLHGGVEPIEGTYPDFHSVITPEKATHTFAVNDLRSVVKDLARTKGFFAKVHNSYYTPHYLRDALLGLNLDAVAHWRGVRAPLTLTDDTGRIAVLMPVRMAPDVKDDALSVSDLTGLVGVMVPVRKSAKARSKPATADSELHSAEAR